MSKKSTAHTMLSRAQKDNSPGGEQFSRELSPGDKNLLCDHWSKQLGISVEKNYLNYLQHRITYIERLCIGRLAADIQDAVLRLLVLLSLRRKTIGILEIGVLFGVNAIIMYDFASIEFNRARLTMIDPLEGYYTPKKRDPITGLPVNKRILLRNLNLFNIGKNDYVIIQNHSSEETAVKRASKDSYNYVFIDGDHSYEGVEADFRLYTPMLEKGGYVVFDNYRDGTSPGVDKFIKQVVMQLDTFEHKGSSWRSAVFQKV